MDRIVVVHLMDLVSYPPVLSLVENLLNNNKKVYLISYGTKKAPSKITDNQNLKMYEVPTPKGKGVVSKLFRDYFRRLYTKNVVKKLMRKADILWTTTDISVRSLGNLVLKYKHVMQLMELEESYPYIVGLKYPRFPLKKYAQKAWKTVVPEINRAYIQKTWWELEKTPIVLPNKPYSIDLSIRDDHIIKAENKLKNESRKIVMYLGNLSSDRSLSMFAKALYELGEGYCLYIVGKIDDSEKNEFESLKKKYNNIEYLGYFTAPTHLNVLKHAYIGLLPYYPNSKHPFISPLNIQYCAPNKIFEYCAFGVPMIGTDVMGLKGPFERYNIGECCDFGDTNSIVKSIKTIEKNYSEISNNCRLYNKVFDLDEIVRDIIS